MIQHPLRADTMIIFHFIFLSFVFCRHFSTLDEKLSFDEICYLAYISWSKFARTDGFVRHLYVSSTAWFHVHSITRSRCCSHRSVIELLLRGRPRIQIDLATVQVSKLNPAIVRVIKVAPYSS